jgi:hypothetical protein
MNEGGANYYPIARESWYPNASSGLGNYATYNMVFHVPKGLELTRHRDKSYESTEGKVTTTEWKTDVPLGRGGLQPGQVHHERGHGAGQAGRQSDHRRIRQHRRPMNFQQMSGGVLGTLNTTSMLPVFS